MRSALIACALILTVNPFAIADVYDWPQWRGPGRNAHVRGLTLPKTLPAKLTRKWTISVGEGYSSPIIAGGRCYVLVRKGEQEEALCVDFKTGKLIWRDKVDAPFDSVIFPAARFGKSPRSTPLFDSGKLYTIGVNGLLTCFDATDGKVIWRKDFSKSFPVPMPICGAALSPLVDRNTLYVHAGHGETGAFFALDRLSGKEIWTWRGEGPAYTSPVLATIGGKPQIVTATHNMWVGLDPATGRLLWSIKNRRNYFNHNSITPVVIGDTVIGGANQRPTIAFRVKSSGAAWSTELLWENSDVTMSTSSPVLSGGRVYALNEKRRGQIVVMDASTGTVRWSCQGNKGEHTTIYDVGEHILAFTSTGDMFAYRKDGVGLTEQARYTVADSAVWASPAISGNKILVKSVDTLTLWEL